MAVEHKTQALLVIWEEFCALRRKYLSALTAVVAQGMMRVDTSHPAFCGCIDWHSSVHGAYALLAASRLTGESQWRDVVEPILSSERLAGELACLQRGELDHELPYGYAWFLKLAQERERWDGQTDLLPLAAEMSSRLKRWVFSLSSDEILAHALRREYGNLSWAMLNLWEWSQWKKDYAVCEELVTFTRERLLPLDESLSLSHDENVDEFFAASLQRTRAILAILPVEESQAWLRVFCPKALRLDPILTAPKPHSAGLNFSRPWGFWSLYRTTGDVGYRDMYVNHIVTHMESPQYWRDDYKKYSHWVSQFGIYAIALSIDEPHA
ncbi:MAG: hypothetical protein NPIRA02_11870 [Nitrospirales bacterium]|nr:MAG: hypothetical protein NPIRA02_11870 [Nitrospirales bacterium]